MLLLNLGLLGAALAGGIAGAGKGISQLADDETERLKQERINEFKMRENEQDARLRYETLDKLAANQQKRGLIDYAGKKKIDIALATDPGNVQAATNAELQAQEAKDKYADKRFPTVLSQEKQTFDVKNPLAREQIQSAIDQNKAQIAHWEAIGSGGDNKNDIEYLKLANSSVEKKLETVSNMPEKTDAEKFTKNMAMKEVNQEMAGLQKIISQKLGVPYVDSASSNDVQQKLVEEITGKSKSEPETKPSLSDKAVGMLGTAVDKAKKTINNDSDKYLEQAKMFLKYGPQGSKYDADLIAIRDNTNLSEGQKAQKIAEYLKNGGYESSGSLKSTLKDYSRLIGL